MKIETVREEITKNLEAIYEKAPELKTAKKSCCGGGGAEQNIISAVRKHLYANGNLPEYIQMLSPDALSFFEKPRPISPIPRIRPIRLNTHDCLNCSKKHLASAIVIMNEILNGYQNTDHEIFLMGNLNEASEQITGFSLEISNALRNLRVDIYEKEKKLTPAHLAKAKELYYNIDELKKGMPQ